MKMSKIIQAVVFFAVSAVSLAPATATAAITQSIKASEMSNAVDGKAPFAFVADNVGLQTVRAEYGHLNDRLPGNPGVSVQSSDETVPEPDEYAMMLVGAGLVGFQVRRKQRQLSKTLWKRR